MPDLTVVMPVYNSEKYLRYSINSILNQTYEDFEFIIINDGSNDDSLNIIQECTNADSRVKVISREHKGLVKSLNQCISIAKGKYIARMDADDISALDRFEKQMKILNQFGSVGVVGSNVNIIGDYDDTVQRKLNLSLNENPEYYILNHWYCLAHPTIMMRKSMLERIGNYRESKAEDLELWLRALKNGYRIYKIKEALLDYRIHSSSKSTLDNLNNSGIVDGIVHKLRYVLERYNVNMERYAIWGAGGGGKLTKQVIDNIVPQAECGLFIDSFKEGYYEGVKIISPEKLLTEIPMDSINYFVIATEPGKEYAMKFLDEIGLDICKDFLCVV